MQQHPHQITTNAQAVSSSSLDHQAPLLGEAKTVNHNNNNNRREVVQSKKRMTTKMDTTSIIFFSLVDIRGSSKQAAEKKPQRE